MKDKTWLRDENSDGDFPAYCPYDEKTGVLSYGLTVIGEAPGKVIGSFLYTPDGFVVTLHEEAE